MAGSTERYNIQAIFRIITFVVMIITCLLSAKMAITSFSRRQFACFYSSTDCDRCSMLEFTNFGLSFFITIFLSTFTKGNLTILSLCICLSVLLHLVRLKILIYKFLAFLGFKIFSKTFFSSLIAHFRLIIFLSEQSTASFTFRISTQFTMFTKA